MRMWMCIGIEAGDDHNDDQTQRPQIYWDAYVNSIKLLNNLRKKTPALDSDAKRQWEQEKETRSLNENFFFLSPAGHSHDDGDNDNNRHAYMCNVHHDDDREFVECVQCAHHVGHHLTFIGFS